MTSSMGADSIDSRAESCEPAVATTPEFPVRMCADPKASIVGHDVEFAHISGYQRGLQVRKPVGLERIQRFVRFAGERGELDDDVRSVRSKICQLRRSAARAAATETAQP